MSLHQVPQLLKLKMLKIQSDRLHQFQKQMIDPKMIEVQLILYYQQYQNNQCQLNAEQCRHF